MATFILIGWNPYPGDGQWEVYEISDRHLPSKRLHQFERETKVDTIRAIESHENFEKFGLGYLSRTQAGQPSQHVFFPSAVNSALRARGEIFRREAYVVWHSAGRWAWGRSAPTNQPMPIRTPSGSEDTKDLAIRAAKKDSLAEDRLGVLVFDTNNIPDKFLPNLDVWNKISRDKMQARGSVSPLRYS